MADRSWPEPAEAAPAEQRIWLIIMGLIISIPLVVAGSSLIIGLLTRYPILVWAGAALLGMIAGELIATEPVLKPYIQQLGAMLGDIGEKGVKRLFEAIGIGIVILLGMLLRKRGSSSLIEH